MKHGFTIVIVTGLLLMISGLFIFSINLLPKQDSPTPTPTPVTPSPSINQDDDAKTPSITVEESKNINGVTTPVTLGFNNADQTIRYNNGTLMVWIEDNNLVLAERDTEGSILSTKIISSGNIKLPAIAASNDAIVVGWTETIEGKNEIRVVVSHDNGTTFGSEKILGTGEGLSLAQTSTTVHAVWHQEASANTSHILYSQLTATIWSTPQKIDTSTREALWASVSSFGNTVIVTWRDNRASGYFSVWTRRSINNGQTWQEEQHIVTEESGDPDVCITGNGTVWLAHHGKGNISLLRSDNNGTDFTSLGTIGNGFFAHLDCTSTHAIVAWEHTDTPSHLAKKQNGWAIYSTDGTQIDSGIISDANSLTTTARFSHDSSYVELIWTKPATERNLDGTLRHATLLIED